MAEDQELVRQVLAGQTQAFEALILKYQQPLFNYLGRMVGERESALDLTQEVFLKAFAALHTYNPNYNFRTWIFRIASHLLIDQWRKKKIPQTSLEPPGDEEGASNFDPVDSRALSVTARFEMEELIRRVEKALQKIPVRLRELFLWRHVNGLSYAEIAEISGLPLGTVKNRVFQAKERIRAFLEEKP